MSTLQDELTKLKNLCDTGELTQSEFDEQRKKLMQQYSSNLNIESKEPQKTNKNLLYFFVVVGVIVGGLALSRAGKSNNDNNSIPVSNSTSNTNNHTTQTPTNSYDRTTVYNQGVEDETHCLEGGVTPSISEERDVFDVKFPNGTDADFQNYKNGCQHAFMEWKSKGN